MLVDLEKSYKDKYRDPVYPSLSSPLMLTANVTDTVVDTKKLAWVVYY